MIKLSVERAPLQEAMPNDWRPFYSIAVRLPIHFQFPHDLWYLLKLVSSCCSCITEIYSISSTQKKHAEKKSQSPHLLCICFLLSRLCLPTQEGLFQLALRDKTFLFCFPTTRPLGSIKRFVLSSRNALFEALWHTMHQQLHKQRGRKCER